MTNTTRLIIPNICIILFVILENFSVYFPNENPMHITVIDISNMLPNILLKTT